jgi:hypothetical protein
LSEQKDICVGELLKFDHGRRWWDFVWRRNLFQWEQDLASNLLNSLEGVSLSIEEDCFVWRPNPSDGFSVKSAYDLLLGSGGGESLSDFELESFSRLWDSPAPPKVIVFSWQLFYERLPTKDNLLLRGVLNQNSGDGNCVWCGALPESTKHLFIHCDWAILVWYEIFKWLGVVLVMPPTLLIFLNSFVGAASSKKSRSGFLLVWHTALWVLWLERNNRIFNGVSKEYKEIVEEIKVLSWKWSVVRLKVAPCLYYEWCWDPGLCFHS